MRALVVDALLLVALASAWIAAAGFARLASSLDRLHGVALATVGCGVPLVLAGFVADGFTPRAVKLLLLVVVALVAGASVNQAAARAIFTRDEDGERM